MRPECAANGTRPAVINRWWPGWTPSTWLAPRLVGGRLNPAADRRFNYARADRDYESAFREAGVGAIGDDTAGVARRIAASTVREPLLAALADWSACADPRESPGVGPRGGAESRPGALARPRP